MPWVELSGTGARFAARLLGSRSEDPLQGTLYFRDSLVGSPEDLFQGGPFSYKKAALHIRFIVRPLGSDSLYSLFWVLKVCLGLKHPFH